jgi:DNA repair exonuclease SbcCD ATPase subunit
LIPRGFIRKEKEMKQLMFFFVLLACAFVLPHTVKSQTVARPTSEQSLQELVAEVRQLRATLQRMNAAIYKGQVMLERLKLQQDQVARVSRELTQVREQGNELRAEQARIKGLVKGVQEGIESGIKHPSELASLKGEIEQLSEREQRLAEREARLENELEMERAKLSELNDQLNALVEIEVAPK